MQGDSAAFGMMFGVHNITRLVAVATVVVALATLTPAANAWPTIIYGVGGAGAPMKAR